MGRVTSKERVIIESFLDLTDRLKGASACDRAKVSCVLTTLDLELVAYGYNGPIRGMPNECERPDEPGNCGCVHAEANAVVKAGQPKVDKIAFISCHPCEQCAKLMIQNGVVMVIYRGPAHRDGYTGLDYLEKMGIPHGEAHVMVQKLLDRRP